MVYPEPPMVYPEPPMVYPEPLLAGGKPSGQYLSPYTLGPIRKTENNAFSSLMNN